MNKITDLEKLKELSTALLYIPIEKTEFYPAIVVHPYFSSAFCQVGRGELANICEDEKALRKMQKMITGEIEAEKTPIGLMALVREPYYLTWLKYAKQYLSHEDFSN